MKEDVKNYYCNGCAFDRGGKCSALTQRAKDYCAFKKTSFLLEEGRKKAMERVLSLPEAELNHIHIKYYKDTPMTVQDTFRECTDCACFIWCEPPKQFFHKTSRTSCDQFKEAKK